MTGPEGRDVGNAKVDQSGPASLQLPQHGVNRARGYRVQNKERALLSGA